MSLFGLYTCSSEVQRVAAGTIDRSAQEGKENLEAIVGYC